MTPQNDRNRLLRMNVRDKVFNQCSNGEKMRHLKIAATIPSENYGKMRKFEKFNNIKIVVIIV